MRYRSQRTRAARRARSLRSVGVRLSALIMPRATAAGCLRFARGALIPI